MTSPTSATSDRQRVQEDDERYGALLAFLRSSLTKVEARWTQWRRKYEVENAKERSPALEEWFNSLPGGFRKSAETLIAKLSALPVDEEDDRKLLYRHGVLAFERMRIRGSTEEFVSSVDELEKLLTMLADRDALEASLYLDIVRSRLEAIREFQGIVDDDAKEAALQKYLFDHLWLLDAAWERATNSEIMESRLIAEGVITEDLTEKEKLGRVDIAYRTNAGKHIIVELKRAGRRMKLLELQEQGQTYVDKLRKIVLAQGENAPNIEVVFVLGKPVDDERDNPDRVKASMAAVSPGSRIVHYDSLILGAQTSYSEYVKKGENCTASRRSSTAFRDAQILIVQNTSIASRAVVQHNQTTNVHSIGLREKANMGSMFIQNQMDHSRIDLGGRGRAEVQAPSLYHNLLTAKLQPNELRGFG